MIITPPTMGPSSPFRKSSKSLCLLLQRPNSVRYISMPGSHSLATPPSQNGPPTTTHTDSNRQL
eukprot:CCRYP_018931-RB/>CCRYP_018931-RB protein AED:0.33 eAED:0.33 QI:0/-1/0/1/-1/0/1/0/63